VGGDGGNTAWGGKHLPSCIRPGVHLVWKDFSTRRMAALAQTAQGVCGISTLGVIQKLSEHGPGQQGLGGPA